MTHSEHYETSNFTVLLLEFLCILRIRFVPGTDEEKPGVNDLERNVVVAPPHLNILFSNNAMSFRMPGTME